jgi:hypothetical protein
MRPPTTPQWFGSPGSVVEPSVLKICVPVKPLATAFVRPLFKATGRLRNASATTSANFFSGKSSIRHVEALNDLEEGDAAVR